jgi:hypothetical protein
MSLTLATAIFWLAVACCAVAQTAIVRSALLAPSSKRAIDITWAVLPGLALTALLVFTWRAL